MSKQVTWRGTKQLKEGDKMVHRIQQFQQFPIHHTNKTIQPKKTKFKDILDHVQELKVSKHAKERLQQRNIHIDEKQWHVIGEKMNEVKQKGVKDSVVILNDAALLVSAKNHTVVTAMGRKEATEKVFTNIDGTILIDD